MVSCLRSPENSSIISFEFFSQGEMKMEKTKLHSGITNLFIAELVLFVSTLGGGTLILLFHDNDIVVTAVSLVLFTLTIVAAIFQLIGLSGLHKENMQLNEAFWLVIGLIVISVLGGLLPMLFPGKIDDNIFSLTTSIVSILITFSLVDGIRQAVPEVKIFGRVTLIIYAITAIAAAVIRVLNVFDQGTTAAAYAVSAIGLVCETIFGIIFIIFLSKAGKATK